MTTSVNAIDYFVTLGVAGQLKIDVSNEGNAGNGQSSKERWENAITEIVMLNEDDEDLDETWEIVDHSIDGTALLKPHIAFQRRKHSKRQDHICKIICLAVGTMVPPCFERVSSSIIAVKRATLSHDGYIAGDSMIDDIIAQLSDDNEEIPDEYFILSHNEQYGYSGDSRHADLVLAYREVAPMGAADCRYVANLLDRYPRHDNKAAPLPAAELPTFVFPYGLRVKYSTSRRFPLPTFFTFVFTDATGGHMYVACLRFYEELPKEECINLLKDIYGDAVPTDIADRVTLFTPKVICVLSSKPFYRAMRRYLRQLYSMSLSVLPCPLEFYITALVGKVPIPYAGGRPIYYVQDAALISETSRAMPAIIFELPENHFFPYLDLDFSAPLRCLSVDNVLAIFTLLLQESKVVFTCQSHNMITETMECLRALLFPLKWATTFISRLPDALTGLFQALGGFIIGFSGCDLANNDVEGMEEGLNSQLNGEGPQIQGLEQWWLESMTPSTYVVDLSTNRLYRYTGQALGLLGPSDINNITQLLPHAPRLRLAAKLHKICQDYHIGPQKSGLTQFDSAFDFQQFGEDEGPTQAQWDRFPTFELRDSFMSLVIEILGDFEHFIINPDEFLTKDSFRSMQEEFRVDEYIANASEPSLRELRRAMCESQMFEYMLQRRAEGNELSILFCEQAARLQRELDLSAKLVTTNNRSNHPLIATELPAPLFKLLAGKQILTGDRTEHAMYTHLGIKPNRIGGQASNSSRNSPAPARTQSAQKQPNSLSPLVTRSSTNPLVICPELDGCSLADILNAVKNLDYIDLLKSFADEEMHSHPSIEHRNELIDNNGAVVSKSFALQDKDAGPLLVPGPLRRQIDKDEWHALINAPTIRYTDSKLSDDTAGIYFQTFVVAEEDSLKFSYARGWPSFRDGLLAAGNDAVHSRVKSFQEIRKLSTEKMHLDCLKLVRPMSERLPFLQFSSKLLLSQEFPSSTQTVSSTSATSSIHTTPIEFSSSGPMRPELMALASALVDLASVSMLLLCTRNILQRRPVTDALQMVGIIAQLEDRGCISLLDEAAWRSVFVSCANTGGPLVRQLAWIVFERIFTLGRRSDSITSGQFARAATALNPSQSERDGSDLVDPFIFLEEMGLTWFIQQRALKEHMSTSTVTGSGTQSSIGNQSPIKQPVAPTPVIPPIVPGGEKRSMFASVSPTNWFRTSSQSPTAVKRVPTPASNPSPQPQSVAVQQSGARKIAAFTNGAAHLTSLQFGLMRNSPFSYLNAGQIYRYPCLRQGFDGDHVSAALEHEHRIKDRIAFLQSEAAKYYSQRLRAKFAGSGDQTFRRRGSAGDQVEAVLNKMGSMIIESGQAGLLAARKSIVDTLDASAEINISGSVSRGANMISRVAVTAAAVASAALPKPGTRNSSQNPTSSRLNGIETTEDNGNDAELLPVRIDTTNNPGVSGGHSFDFDEEEEDDDEVDEDALADDSTLAAPNSDTKVLKSRRKSRRASAHHPYTQDTSDGKIAGDVDSSSFSRNLNDDLTGAVEETQVVLDQLGTNDTEHSLTDVPLEAVLPSSGNTQTESGSMSEEQVADESVAPVGGAVVTRPNAVQLQSEVLAILNTDFLNRESYVGIYSQTSCSCGFTMLDDETLAALICQGSLDNPNGKASGPYAFLDSSTPSTPTNSANGSGRRLSLGSDSPARQAAAAAQASLNSNAPQPPCSRTHPNIRHILCPQCAQPLEPQLHIRAYKSEACKHLTTFWSADVLYMSPFVVRRRLEELLERLGTAVVDPQWLNSADPSLFWSLVWYCSRLSLPTGFLYEADSILPTEFNKILHSDRDITGCMTSEMLPFPIVAGAVFAGWKETTLKARIRTAIKIFNEKNSIPRCGSLCNATLTIEDVFAGCSEDERELLARSAGNLDGSMSGTRRALIDLATSAGIMSNLGTGTKRASRNAYVGLLMLYTVVRDNPSYHNRQPGTPGASLPSIEQADSQFHESHEFDKSFVDAIRCAMSSKDFIAMQTTESELIDSTSNKLVAAVRHGFGMLL